MINTQWTETSLEGNLDPQVLDGNYYWTLRRVN
jgi:hypothetical protein